jgi:hypothetical protein
MKMQILGVDVTSNDSTPVHALGQEYCDDQGKKYRYVKLLNETATVTGASGDAVAYLADPSDDTEEFTVVTDNTDASAKPVCAGLLNTTVAGATGTAEYVWVQCGGPAVANQTLAGPPLDGDTVFLSTTDKTLTLSTAADDPVCASVKDASADKITLHCP